jgi:glycosyltransferase involved in cell wall biosynthesis
METEKNICIVIPCYNEEKKLRLQLDEFNTFIKENPDVLLCFVNDGSSDNTVKIIEEIKTKNEENVDMVSYTKNVGKAEAVRRGVHRCNSKYDHVYIAYLDADLSTPLQECVRLRKYLNEKIEFCFGSRIMQIGSIIERKFYRFFIGRIIATFISNILDLKVYDTQCGCKLFTKNLSIQLFETEFISKWLFDVEIFFRMIEIYGRNQVLGKMIEVPVNKWVDSGTSKVKASYCFKLWIDLYRIRKTYKRKASHVKFQKSQPPKT